MSRFRRAAVPALLLCALMSGRASAQCWGAVPCPEPEARLSFAGEVQTAAINSALGGVTAGLLRRARGGSFREGFLAGAAGGALVYAGKRVAAEPWGGAGLLGREVAAVGSSVVWNASAGRAPLERVVLPVGPVRLYVERGPGPRVRPKLDFASAAALALVAAAPGTELDWGESLSAGAPIFRRTLPYHGDQWQGEHVAGVISYRAEDGRVLAAPGRRAQVLAHERVHVIQHDQAFLFWSEPAERALLGRSRLGRALGRHVDLGLNVPALGAFQQFLPYRARPWEREASLLGGTGEVGGHGTGGDEDGDGGRLRPSRP
ncbi:MAG TPA: hypothetical protein VF746_06070 [Longimicrobium sp.]|jgi:hypothetical protein